MTIYPVCFLCQLVVADVAPVHVGLVVDRPEVQAGGPLLVKVEVVNRSSEALPFNPPLGTRRLNLVMEARPPGEAGYRRIGLPTGEPRPPSFAGVQPGSRHVGYQLLHGQHLGLAPGLPRPKVRREGPVVLAAEGEWQLRAGVVVDGTRWWSDPVRVVVRGRPPDRASEALEACAASLRVWTSAPVGLPEGDAITTFRKHAAALEGIDAAVPVRLAIHLADVSESKTAAARAEAVTRVRGFQKDSPPLWGEYADLLLAVAFVKAEDYSAARAQLRALKDEDSAIKRYIQHHTRPTREEK
jgi:hypothetical protein